MIINDSLMCNHSVKDSFYVLMKGYLCSKGISWIGVIKSWCIVRNWTSPFLVGLVAVYYAVQMQFNRLQQIKLPRDVQTYLILDLIGVCAASEMHISPCNRRCWLLMILPKRDNSLAEMASLPGILCCVGW